MAKSSTDSKKKPIEQYQHKDKKRVNNPSVGLVTSDSDKELPKKKYKYDHRLHLQLQWTGKAERVYLKVD